VLVVQLLRQGQGLGQEGVYGGAIFDGVQAIGAGYLAT
jgi:hypothetical protein